MSGASLSEAAFLDAGVWYGPVDEAAAILARNPEIANSSIYTAALLGDDTAVRRFIARDPASATARGGPRDWDALTYLCFSKYLRLEPARSDGFVRAAEALLDAGADPNTGFYETKHQPHPEFESALYGAAGVAHHAVLTRLLIGRGADPNDGEVPYHTAEGYDNGALQVIVESGRLTADNLTTMLLRKHDWHDYHGIKWLLEHGANPNRTTHWGRTAFQKALLRDNGLPIIELLLDHGADPGLATGLSSPIALAGRRGRDDVLELFENRGVPVQLSGLEALLAACARNQDQQARTIAAQDPKLVRELIAEGGRCLAQFAGNGNTEGVRLLIDLGVDVRAELVDGDEYWDLANNTTALHTAAWRARHATVNFLIERGAPVNAQDAKGRTPLALAVRACVDSYWTTLRSPESVAALLKAGASIDGIPFPSGYPEVDALLQKYVTT